MAKSEYKKQYEERLKNADEAQTSMENSLRSRGPGNVDHESLQNLPFVKSNSALRRLIEIVNNKNEKPEVRATALEKTGIQVSESQELLDWVLSILKNKQLPDALRISALAVLQQSSFRTAKFNPTRPDYLAALRAIVEEETGELAAQAIEILALSNDLEVQQKLLRGLESPAESKIAPEKAIQLLGHDVHGEYFPLLRNIVRNPPNVQSKIEAIRLLAADPDSRDLLFETLNDQGQDQDVRASTAIAFQALDPGAFENFAKKAILNENEDDELRTICLAALAQQAQAGELSDDTEFNNKVSQLPSQPVSEDLKRSSSQYMKNVLGKQR